MKEYKEEEYRIIFGVEKETFDKMVAIIAKEYESTHKKGAEKMAQIHKNKLK